MTHFMKKVRKCIFMEFSMIFENEDCMVTMTILVSWDGLQSFRIVTVSWWPIGWTVDAETINLSRVYSSTSSWTREIVLGP